MTLVNDWLDAPDPVAPKVVVPATAGPARCALVLPAQRVGRLRPRAICTGRDVTDDPVARRGSSPISPRTRRTTSRSANNRCRARQQAAATASTASDRQKPEPRTARSMPITAVTNDKSESGRRHRPALNRHAATRSYRRARFGDGACCRRIGAAIGAATMDDNNLPLDYDEPLSQKVMIFMTDGNNTMPSRRLRRQPMACHQRGRPRNDQRARAMPRSAG